ncbi:MAG: hypothetical protein M5U13_04965 [Thermoanaerobaculia bacterium]|nr:hypothetical protein [Thermoanaerobaculia bacterium]
MSTLTASRGTRFDLAVLAANLLCVPWIGARIGRWDAGAGALLVFAWAALSLGAFLKRVPLQARLARHGEGESTAAGAEANGTPMGYRVVAFVLLVMLWGLGVALLAAGARRCGAAPGPAGTPAPSSARSRAGCRRRSSPPRSSRPRGPHLALARTAGGGARGRPAARRRRRDRPRLVGGRLRPGAGRHRPRDLAAPAARSPPRHRPLRDLLPRPPPPLPRRGPPLPRAWLTAALAMLPLAWRIVF